MTYTVYIYCKGVRSCKVGCQKVKHPDVIPTQPHYPTPHKITHLHIFIYFLEPFAACTMYISVVSYIYSEKSCRTNITNFGNVL